jgi:hypothetical protein
MRILSICMALSLCGCAHSVKELTRSASRAAVDESVDELTAPETRDQLADTLQDPRTEKALVALTNHVTEGILKSLESERAHKQLATLTAMATRVAAQQIIAVMGAPETRAQLETMTDAMTRALLTSVVDTLATDVVPSMREAFAHDFAHGVADPQGAAGPLHAALGATAQNVAFNAVLGANDGLRRTWRAETGAAGDVRAAARGAAPWASLLFLCLGLATLMLLSVAAIVIARARRARTEVMRLESATLLLATAMREKHANAETDEIVAVVRDALEKSAHEHRHHGLFGFLRLRGHSH